MRFTYSRVYHYIYFPVISPFRWVNIRVISERIICKSYQEVYILYIYILLTANYHDFGLISQNLQQIKSLELHFS